MPPVYPKRHTGELHVRKHDLYTDAYGDSNSYAYPYCNADAYTDGDGNPHPDRYCNSYTYFDTETFTDGETGVNAETASHAATALVAVYEKETH